MLNSLIHILRRRPLRLFLEILLIFFLHCCQSITSRISKLVGAVFVPISKQRNVRGSLTQLSARGISSAAVYSPFYCCLRSRPFFLVLFPSCFLRLPCPPPSFFHAVFRLFSSSVPSLRGNYRHSLFPHIPPIRLHFTFLFGIDCV